MSCATTALLLGALPAQAIVNGTPTTSFRAVGELGGASGVLIADNWVLTAAHVAKSLTAGLNRFDSLDGSSLISAIHVHPGASFPGDDIALLQLRTPLGTFAPILNDRVIEASQVAALGPLTMASAQNQDPNGYAFTTASRAATTYTPSAGPTFTVNWLLTHGRTQVQGGDSGSALFAGNVSDSAGELLLGVASAILFNDITGAFEGSAYVQLAPYRDWIDATMAPSGQQATWVSAVPEPSSLLLGALGGLAILAIRGGHSRRNG